MSVFRVPPAVEERSFVQETELDGTTYRLTFRWNVREGFWYVDVATTADVPIASGLKLVAGAFFLRRVAIPPRPAGDLMVTETPTESSFGNDAVLLYLDEDEF
jgi:hypothetical protein